MDPTEEQIDIVGDGSDQEDDSPMDTSNSPRPCLSMPSFPHLPLPNMPSFPLPGTSPLSVQITPDTEPSGAKKRKPQKVTKLQVYDDEPEAPALSPGGESGLELGSDLVEGDYKCPICSKVMATQKEFTSHLRGHNEVKPSPDPSDPTGQAKVYNCCLCGKMLSSFSSLDRHMLVHSGERPFSCMFCGQTFTTNGNMHRHQRTHGLKAPGEGDSEGKLPNCGLLAQNRKRKEPGAGGSGNTTEDDTSGAGTNNNTGAKEMFSAASVSCPVCKETFINDISVETHILTSHPGQHLKCDSCPAMYPTFQNLKLHKYLHHLSSIPSSFPSSSIPNPFTAFMASQQEKSPLKIPFHSGDTMEEDSRSHSPPAKPVKSQLEGALTRPLVKDKDLADIPSIITMAQNFPGINKGESKPCENSAAEPDMTLEEDDEAGSPKKMRLEEDPPFDDDPVIKEMKLKGEFPCSLCPAVFPNLRALKGHNKEHLGKAPYRCNVGTCTYSSNDKSTLTRHMRRHTGEKPFECKICQFGFTTKANCERHLKNKHQKLTRESIRESLIIHETEDTETMISRMQMTGDVTVGSQARGGGHRSEADLAFRCKVCKFTFMSKFAAVQHGIHNHPEYAENIDEIAEPVGVPGAGAGAKPDLRSPDIIEIVSPPRAKIKNMSNFYPNVGDAGDRDIAADTEEAPLDLSQSNSNDDDIAERRESSDSRKEPGHKTGLPLPGPMFPPGLPYFLPGQSPFPLLPFYPSLMMPGLFSGDKEAQEKHLKELMTRMQLQAAAGAAPRPPFAGPPALSQGLDIASMMAAQAEAIRKQAELKQQQEAAETLQKLSQMQVLPGAQAGLNKSAVNMSEEGTNSDSGTKVKESEAQYKMVMKNGVLMKKQKQRRYRTERPYSCQSCTARFTLRSNMERHIKQQHPETWGDKLKGSRRNFGNMTVPHISPELKDMAEAEADAEKEENEGEEEGELIIDDAPEDMEDDKPQPDLASISNLLNAANNQSFNQYFNGSQDEDSNVAREMAESNSDTEARDGERKSAYSAAPHKMSCPYCARKFPWESSLKRHILTHTGQKPFKCRECPLWFTTKSNCDRHQVRKHGDTVMGASKHLNMELRDNENTENEDIDDDAEDNVGVVSSYFKCHLCDEDFITRDHVIAHIEHEHQDAYNEDKDVYETASKMASEIKKPSEACKEDEICRRVNCIFCPCQFVSTNELRKHVLAHVNNKPFACDICHKKFTIKQALMRHKKKHDSGVSSDDENSEEDLPHYRLGMPPAIRALEPGPEDNSEAAKMSPMASAEMSPAPETTVTKRANLMDTINKLSAARAESSKSKRSTLDQIFGVPPPVAGFMAGSSM